MKLLATRHCDLKIGETPDIMYLYVLCMILERIKKDTKSARKSANEQNLTCCEWTL